MSTSVRDALCGSYEMSQHDGSLREHADGSLELVAELRYLVRLGEAPDPNA